MELKTSAYSISVNLKVEILQLRIWTIIHILMITEVAPLEKLDKSLQNESIFVLSKTQIDLLTIVHDANASTPLRKW
jgi:hypothetical protein